MSAFGLATSVYYINGLETTEQFYIDYLGFSIDTRWPDEIPEVLILDQGHVRLMFVAENQPVKRSKNCQLNIDCEDVLSLHSYLKQHLDIIWGPEIYHYGRREFAVYDPNGIMIVFSEQTKDSPTCFS